jgi:patatin-like phospholipase/acyl hydrolase
MTSVADDPVTGVVEKGWKLLVSLFAPQYDANALRRELEAAFKNAERKVLGQSRCRLVIPAVHARTGSVHVFCTDHHPDLTQYADTPAATVALATAAAPTFFAAATVGEGLYLDGGLWANNPSLAALSEAVARLHVPLDHIDILSVGTTSEPYTGGQANEGFIGWLKGKRIINLLMHAQEQGTVALANELAGRARVLRINQTLAPGQVSLADVSGIPTLRDDGLRAGADRATLADVKARFLNGIKVAPWKETAA